MTSAFFIFITRHAVADYVLGSVCLSVCIRAINFL